MENTLAKQLFGEQFMFFLNQEVRHKGDSKAGIHSSDLGLLILRRNIEEHSDDDGNVHYTRNYICRMIKFSGSGELAQFKESELMSIADYNKRSVENDEERDRIRNHMHSTRRQIFESFGVKNGTEVYLKKDGVADKSNIYTVNGYQTNKDETFLHLSRVVGEGKTSREEKVKSKSEFEIVES